MSAPNHLSYTIIPYIASEYFWLVVVWYPSSGSRLRPRQFDCLNNAKTSLTHIPPQLHLFLNIPPMTDTVFWLVVAFFNSIYCPADIMAIDFLIKTGLHLGWPF
jgi:hypothetical protein